MNQLNTFLSEYIYNPFDGDAGTGAILEGVLSGDLDTDVVRSVEVEDVLKNHNSRTFLQSHRWEGDTLNLIYDGYGYMYEFQEIYDDLKCNRIKIYPQAVVRNTSTLKNVYLGVGTRMRFDERCDLENCVLECKVFKNGGDMGVDMTADKSGNISIKNSTFKTSRLKLRGVNKASFQGNNFDQVKTLSLTNVGKNIKRIVLGWNFATEFKDGFSSYPWPKGEFDKSLDPIKALGLNKHFKNLEQLNIAISTSGNCDYICYTKDTHHQPHGWGVKKFVEMGNGWKMLILNDPRML